MQYLRYCFKGMGNNIGSFEILLQLVDFRGQNWIFEIKG